MKREPMFPGVLAVAGAFLRRDALVAASQRVPFVFDVLSVVFVLLELLLLSRIVGPNEVAGGYFAFALSGLVVALFVFAGVSVVAGAVRQEQWQGTLEATLSAGISAPRLAAGLVAYPMISGIVRAFVMVAAGALLGARVAPGVASGWGVALAALALGTISFVGIGLIAASLVLVFRQAAAGTGWLLTMLTFAGGVVFPVRLLPEWVRSISRLSPLTQTLQVVRRAVLVEAPLYSLRMALLGLAAMGVIWMALALAALKLGLRRARKNGTLAQY